MIANRVQFFKIAGLMLEVLQNPSIHATESYIHKVLDVVDEVDEVNEIVGYLNNAFFQYQIDATTREKLNGV